MPSDLSRLPIQEIRRRWVAGDEPVTPALLRKLARDRRRGVRQLRDALERRFERERAERLRLDAMLNFERVLWRSGVERIAGVDESGVSPLAGPIVAAAVVFPPGTELAGVDDCKRLDPDARVALDAAVRERASGVGIGVAEVAEIDELNPYHAGLLAMRRAVLALPEAPQHVLVDARTIPELDVPQNAFFKGDGIDFSIAAASIVAKVWRDRHMAELDARYPGYGFAKHKGYPTRAHQQAIRRLGTCALHRTSYAYLRELQGEASAGFYELKDEVFAAADGDGLRAVEARIAEARQALDEVEHRKLRAAVLRRWKRLEA